MNDYQEWDDCVEIHLTRGQSCFIDKEDLEKIQPFSWCYQRIQTRQYAVARVARKVVRMHVFLLNRIGARDRLEIDHIDGNGLNNRRYNLRVVTHQTNCENSTAKSSNKSGVTGIRQIQDGRWQAWICINYKTRYLGTFASKEDAWVARKKAESERDE